ncbi:MAG: ATP-binding protein [Jannaschia sp.]
MRTEKRADFEDLRLRIEAYLAVDAAESGSRWLSHALVLAGILLVVLTGMTPWLLLFPPIFFVSDESYVWHNAVRRRAPVVTWRTLRLLQLHPAVSITVFSCLAIYMAVQPDPMMQRVAALIIFAQGINCIGIDTGARDRAIVATVILSLMAQIVTFRIVTTVDGPVQNGIVLHLLVAIVSIFFCHICLSSTRMRSTLQDRTAQLLVVQKGEAVGRLTTGIAHDFNNLLTVMRGNLDLLEEVPEPEQARLLAEIKAAADRGGDLVGTLMSGVSRDGRLRAGISIQPFLLRFSTFARRVLPANITLCVMPGEQHAIQVNVAQLEAALLNLVINGRDAMPTGGTITLSASAEGDFSRRWLRIDVSDDGPGMTESVLAKAMSPYFTTKPKGQGTGLGLAMVRAFAESENGRFTISSTVGAGTRASLWLPA